MTKEEIQYEAQRIIQEWGSNDSAPYVEFVEKLASMELQETPSNLDEAALKELQVYLPQGNGPDGICYFIAPQMLAMYKAGAELMAAQGETIEGEVMKDINNNLCVTAKGFSGKEAKFGDKVVVQIRKK